MCWQADTGDLEMVTIARKTNTMIPVNIYAYSGRVGRSGQIRRGQTIVCQLNVTFNRISHA
jgi:hypothetical protein